MRGEDGGRHVGRERGDGVEVGELEQQRAAVHDEVQEIAVHLVVTVGQDPTGTCRRREAEGHVFGRHALSIPSGRLM